MNQIKPFQFLIVEDEREIADIICLFLGGRFAAAFTIVSSGQQAIEAMTHDPHQFQMVISDFNMPHGNGKVVFDYMKKNAANTPFILVTSDSWNDHSDFHNHRNVGYVSKPFVDDTLVNEVERLMKVCSVEGLRVQAYVGISLQTLLSIKTVSHPIFVKLNEEKYVRFVHQGTEINEEDVQRYRQKGISYLFVERVHFSDFISRFRQKVLNDMVFKGLQSRVTEALDLSAAVQEIVLGATKTFGLSIEAQELALKNVQLVKTLSIQTPELEAVFRWAHFSSQEYSFVHSVLLCYLTTEVVLNLEWSTPHASEMLSLAACFHDLALENHQIKNEQRFVKGLSLHTNINREDMLAVREHPEAAARLVATWPVCPLEVLTIIKEHHERPDGAGFPARKASEQINPLSACFIVCEALVQCYLEHKDRVVVEKYFRDQSKFFGQGTFKKVHDYLLFKLGGGISGKHAASY